jgi:3-hydroxyisobutyrate dehydrogenase/2-hydroxy-3-oxopropionate reductase
MTDTPTVAVLGAGRMGAAMAGTLARAGFPVVLWNRTQATADAVAESIGGDTTAAASIADAVEAAGVVITSLADDGAVRTVYTGDGGLGSAVADGAVVLEMSTIAPATVREVAPAIEARNADLVDAPVSGSVAFAAAGELTIMAGGRADAVERARPVLEAVSKRIFHLGRLGAGATMKLAVNSLLHGLNVALSEALVLVEAAGVNRADAYDVFVAGAVGAPFVAYKRAAYLEPEATPVAFSLDLVRKDLDLILELAGEVGAPMAQASTNRELVDDAVQAGMADRDLSAVAVFLRQLRAEPAG